MRYEDGHGSEPAALRLSPGSFGFANPRPRGVRIKSDIDIQMVVQMHLVRSDAILVAKLDEIPQSGR